MVAYPLTKSLYRFAAGVVTPPQKKGDSNTRRAVQAASSTLSCPKEVPLGGHFSCHCDVCYMLVKIEKLRVANAVYLTYPSRIEVFYEHVLVPSKKKGNNS
jgi:hypothetical protein